ncbi:Ankyrin-2 [Schistosoma japonicum]|uniref:Ankyrin-2 n=1 Tax=Schistosoma japonicum TaxID=6182 RepID=A0A4Z2DW17_SCHJA|nr:Ankyrin-2 [Schistosoma japonicum]
MTSSTTIPGLAFYDALINNNIVELKRLIELHKIDLNARLSHVRKRNHTDLCPVHLVAYKGNLAMLHYLIQNGVNVHQPTCTLRRPVHYAALRQQVSCLQMLLNAGAQIDARDTFGNTPLHYAAEDGDGGLLSLLLNNGACVDAQDITNKTPLMKAARSGKVWAVRRLLLFGANVNVKDRNDETALHFACRQGSTEITRMLIKAESRLNAQNQIGLTPLMESVSYNQREAVSLLIKQKDIDLYKRDFSTGDTALHIAVKKNYIHIVEILLRAGNWYIEYNYNNLGESFVHDVIAYNRMELLRLFLAYNYDLDRSAKRYPPNIQLLSSSSSSSSAATAAVE